MASAVHAFALLSHPSVSSPSPAVSSSSLSSLHRSFPGMKARNMKVRNRNSTVESSDSDTPDVVVSTPQRRINVRRAKQMARSKAVKKAFAAVRKRKESRVETHGSFAHELQCLRQEVQQCCASQNNLAAHLQCVTQQDNCWKAGIDSALQGLLDIASSIQKDTSEMYGEMWGILWGGSEGSVVCPVGCRLIPQTLKLQLDRFVTEVTNFRAYLGRLNAVTVRIENDTSVRASGNVLPTVGNGARPIVGNSNIVAGPSRFRR